MTSNQKKYNKEYYSRPDIKSSHSNYMKQYYKKNRTNILERQSEYYLNNKEKIKLYMKVYMRTYKKSNSVKFGKNMINVKSKVVNVLDTKSISSVADDDTNQ